MTQVSAPLVGDLVIGLPRPLAPRSAPHDETAPETAPRRVAPRQWGLAGQQAWQAAHGRILMAADLTVLVVAMGAAQLARFGVEAVSPGTTRFVSYVDLGALLAVAWWVSLHLHRTRSPRVIGHGPEEYRRVVVATFRVFAGLALLSLAFEFDASRGYLAIAFPLGLVGLLAGRKIARMHLRRQRRQGKALSRVLVVGGHDGASQIVEWFRRNPAAGYDVAGFWVPDDSGEADLAVRGTDPLVPMLTASRSLQDALMFTEAEAVLVTDTAQLGTVALRELTWELDGTGVELFFSPTVLDFASSRLHLHDVSGMPMLHVEAPQYPGANRFTKAIFDRVGALAALFVFLPVLVATAVAVKLSSPGPVFYRQERVGQDGRRFDMIKFRSMRVNADSELMALLNAQGKSVAELPKVTDDPRVTGVGRFIRRFSLDELPQLFNVLKGDMSLVGPRPQRLFEVELYDRVAHRRLAVRPGMTGLWQVSGRSNLSFAEAIRLDVYYVENWSMTSDVIILWKTARAVLASEGAY